MVTTSLAVANWITHFGGEGTQFVRTPLPTPSLLIDKFCHRSGHIISECLWLYPLGAVICCDNDVTIPSSCRCWFELAYKIEVPL